MNIIVFKKQRKNVFINKLRLFNNIDGGSVIMQQTVDVIMIRSLWLSQHTNTSSWSLWQAKSRPFMLNVEKTETSFGLKTTFSAKKKLLKIKFFKVLKVYERKKKKLSLQWCVILCKINLFGYLTTPKVWK